MFPNVFCTTFYSPEVTERVCTGLKGSAEIHRRAKGGRRSTGDSFRLRVTTAQMQDFRFLLRKVLLAQQLWAGESAFGMPPRFRPGSCNRLKNRYWKL